MPYAQTSMLALRTKLLERLDNRGVFYTDIGVYPEIGLLILEAIRVWQALTWRTKRRITVDLVPGQTYYDLHTLGDFPQLITVQQVAAEMSWHLLEGPQVLGWSGTSMFTQDEVYGAIQRRRDQFLMDSGIILAERNSNPLVPGETLSTFPQDVIDLRRVSWRKPNGTRKLLWRSDELEADTASGAWRYQPQLTPVAWSVVRTPVLQARVMPGATTPGILDVLAVTAGATVTPLVNQWLGIPDDLAWVVKWGAMADLLSQEDQSRDPERAEYCRKRYYQGVELAKERPVVMGAQILGKWLPVGTMHDLDAGMPTWMNVTGRPKALGSNGYTFCVGPMPDQPYKITLDILESANVDLGGNAQIGLEEVDTIIDIAHHLATFKQAGMEWKATYPLFQNALIEAETFNNRLRAMSIFRDWIGEGGRAEEQNRVRLDKGEVEE